MGNFFGYYILLILQIETRQKKYWKNYFKIYVILIYQIELVLTSHENQKEKKMNETGLSFNYATTKNSSHLLLFNCYYLPWDFRESNLEQKNF